jgi:hypothetical protein
MDLQEKLKAINKEAETLALSINQNTIVLRELRKTAKQYEKLIEKANALEK